MSKFIYDKSVADRLEKQLLDSLKNLEGDLKDLPPTYKLEDFMPEEKEFEFKDTDISIDEDKVASAEWENTIGKNQDKSLQEGKFNNKTTQMQYSADKQKLLARKEKERAEAKFLNDARKSLNRSLDRGILNSSIAEADISEKGKLKQSEVNASLDKISTALSDIDSEIAATERLRKKAEKDLDENYAKKLNGQIEKLEGERDKKIAEAIKFNNSQTNKKEDYEESKIKAAKEYRKAVEKERQQEIDYENKTGKYYGKKGENYDSRLDLAIKTYKKFPKKDALELMETNYALKQYLGKYYARLVNAIAGAR